MSYSNNAVLLVMLVPVPVLVPDVLCYFSCLICTVLSQNRIDTTTSKSYICMFRHSKPSTQSHLRMMAANLAIKYNSSIRLVGAAKSANAFHILGSLSVCAFNLRILYSHHAHAYNYNQNLFKARARARSPQTKQQGNEIKSESITVNTLMHSCIQNTCVSAAFFRSWP